MDIYPHGDVTASTWVRSFKVQWGLPLIALGSISADEQNKNVELTPFEVNQFANTQSNYAFA